jgi:hypothetical protein
MDTKLGFSKNLNEEPLFYNDSRGYWTKPDVGSTKECSRLLS